MRRPLSALLSLSLAFSPVPAAASKRAPRASQVPGAPSIATPAAPALAPALPRAFVPTIPAPLETGRMDAAARTAHALGPKVASSLVSSPSLPGPEERRSETPQESPGITIDAGRARFDRDTRWRTASVAVVGALAAGAVILAAPAPVIALTPALPAAVEASRLAHLPSPKIPKEGVLDKVGQAVESAAIAVPFALAASLAAAAFAGGPWLVPALAVIGYGAAAAMRMNLAQRRSIIVGGWQASHDQRYRVSHVDGQLRDVRGHKYGQDRYDATVPGPVSKYEEAAFRLVAASAGLLALSALGAERMEIAAYNLALGGLYALSWLRAAQRGPYRPPLVEQHER